MSDSNELKSIKEYCDNRAALGREEAVRDPNDKLGYKNKFIELVLQQAIDEEITISNSDVVLDLGCGTGILTEAIAQKAGVNVVGLDISSEMLKIAANNKSPNIIYCLYNGTSAPLASKSFDYIITREIFHLFSDNIASQIIKECNRILKPEGRMISMEFGSSNPKRQNGSLGRFERHPDKMNELFENNNLKCIKHYPIRRGKSLIQYMIRYGLYNENALARLAQRERKKLRNKNNYTSNYNIDYLYAFQIKTY